MLFIQALLTVWAILFPLTKGNCEIYAIQNLEQKISEKYAMIERSVYEDQFFGIVLLGRLGNNLFQLATGLANAWDHNLTPLCPQIFGELCTSAKEERIRSLNFQHVQKDVCIPNWPVYENLLEEYPEIASKYNPDQGIYLKDEELLLEKQLIFPNSILVSFLFSENNFLRHKEKIKSIFRPSKRIQEFLSNNYPRVYKNTDSIGIHFRDFKNDGHDIYVAISSDYYIKALKEYREKKCYVFSNNLQKAKKLFRKVQKKVPEKEFYFIRTERDYVDFYLLSSFKNIIMSNSTFSWWAAYLCPFEDRKIVCPKRKNWLQPGVAEEFHNWKGSEGFFTPLEGWIYL